MPKILVLDIETKPNTVYTWGLFNQNVGLPQIKEAGGPICFAAKWVGEKSVFFHAEWQEGGHKAMVEAAHALISEADAVVTYNGDKFDLTKLTGEFLLAGLAPPPPPTSIDLYKTIRKMGFTSGKLGYVGPLLGLGGKVENAGFSLWVKVMAGNPVAQKAMERYCVGDVKLTEKLYVRVLPYIRNHPHLGNTGRGACGSCGSAHLQSRGTRRTKAFSIQRLQCQQCGSWQDGTRKKVT